MPKLIPVVAAGVTALAVAGGSFAYATETKDVTLSVDGATSQLTSRSDTVGDVLQAEGITIGQHDVVAPALDAEVSDGSRIAVRYGRQLTVKVDGRPQTMWTTATRVDQALAALKVNTSGAALSTSRGSTIGRQGLALDVTTRKTVHVDAAGQKKRIQTTGRTVADALAASRITVDGDDKLNAPAGKPLTNGAAIVYTKVDTTTLTKKKSVSPDTVHRRTNNLKKGVRQVDIAGRAGTRTLTFRQVRHNGKVVSQQRIDSEVTAKPRNKVVLVGTKVTAPKPERKVSTSSKSSKRSSGSNSSSKRSSAPKVASGGVWDRIARCESGGNWSINTGNGYYGGLQFSKSTWRAFGGSGMPNHASRSRQIAVAKKVQRSQGWGAWPSCTRKLGLR
ncbi:MAG TPA: transglycosylase family protein [Propionibacteriaceae bacterium]|nr:transglycosylase family protein [Propionibacteriaceae bacterium]